MPNLVSLVDYLVSLHCKLILSGYLITAAFEHQILPRQIKISVLGALHCYVLDVARPEKARVYLLGHWVENEGAILIHEVFGVCQ